MTSCASGASGSAASNAAHLCDIGIVPQFAAVIARVSQRRGDWASGLRRETGGSDDLLLGDHKVHGNVVRFGGQCVDQLRVGDDPDAEGVRCKGCKESVVDARASAEPLPAPVEGEAWDDHRGQAGGANRGMGAGNWHVPGVRLTLVAVPSAAGDEFWVHANGLEDGRAARSPADAEVPIGGDRP